MMLLPNWDAPDRLNTTTIFFSLNLYFGQVLWEVCDRVTCLWQVKNKPPLLQHLLETFYQKQLDFGQVDLLVLEAIESYLGKT